MNLRKQPSRRAVLALTPLAARAAYPERPVRLMLPFGLGSATDTLMRLVAEPLGSATNSIVANPAGVQRNVPFDPFRDFTPITRLAATSYVLVVAADKPWKTIRELVDHTRANPGMLNYGSGNLGGVLYGGMLARSIGVEMTHVPYKSTPPALVDLIGGQLQWMFTEVVTASELVKGGKVRALLATALQRSALFPDVPTIAEAGLRGIADLRARLLALGLDTTPSTPQALAASAREQSQSYVRLIKEFGIQPK